jgi:hypothetical protein
MKTNYKAIVYRDALDAAALVFDAMKSGRCPATAAAAASLLEREFGAKGHDKIAVWKVIDPEHIVEDLQHYANASEWREAQLARGFGG